MDSRKQYVKLMMEIVESQRLVSEGESNLTETEAKWSLIQAIWPVVSQSATKHDFDLLTKSVVYLHHATQVVPKRRHRHLMIEPDLDLPNNIDENLVDKEIKPNLMTQVNDGPFKQALQSSLPLAENVLRDSNCPHMVSNALTILQMEPNLGKMLPALFLAKYRLPENLEKGLDFRHYGTGKAGDTENVVQEVRTGLEQLVGSIDLQLPAVANILDLELVLKVCHIFNLQVP